MDWQSSASEDDRVKGNQDKSIEERKLAFKRFVKSLPRICSPAICNSLGLSKDPKDDDDILPPQELVKSPRIEEIKRESEDEDDFNWSIDQIAVLHPCDFPYDPDFNQEMTQYYDSSMEVEDEKFFNQLEIIPSPRPVMNKSIITPSSVKMHSITRSPAVVNHKPTFSPFAGCPASPQLASSFCCATDNLLTPDTKTAPLDFSTPVTDSNILFSSDICDKERKNNLVSTGLVWKGIDQIPAISPYSCDLPKYTSTPGHDLPPYDYKPCTPPPSQSGTQSSSSILTPNLNFNKTRHKKKLFCDN